jgi:hypothetical protein
MISFHQAKSYRFLINDSPTAKEIDYDKYLNPVGLNLIGTSENGKADFKLTRILTRMHRSGRYWSQCCVEHLRPDKYPTSFDVRPGTGKKPRRSNPDLDSQP